MNVFTWCITMLSLAGVVLNIRQDRRCFYLWIITNTVWMVIDYRKGLDAQAALFAVYLMLSIWGVCKWKKHATT